SAGQASFDLGEASGFGPAAMPHDPESLSRLVIHPDDHARFLAQFQTLVQSRSPDWYAEHRVVHRDGSVHWRLSRGTLLYDEAGRLTSFTGTFADITRLKEIESELARAREAAQAANRAKDEFLANASHAIPP